MDWFDSIEEAQQAIQALTIRVAGIDDCGLAPVAGIELLRCLEYLRLAQHSAQLAQLWQSHALTQGDRR